MNRRLYIELPSYLRLEYQSEFVKNIRGDLNNNYYKKYGGWRVGDKLYKIGWLEL